MLGTASPSLSMLTSYRTPGANEKKFGPPAGSSNGIQLLMIVVVVGLSGLTNAYRSVPSTCGSAATNGASRWLDALPGVGPRPVITPAPSAAVAARAIPAFRNRLPIEGNEGPPSSIGNSGQEKQPRRSLPARTLRAGLLHP